MKKLQNTVVRVEKQAVCVLALSLFSGILYAGVTENTEPSDWAGSNKNGSVSVVNAGGGMVSVSFGAQDPTQIPQYTTVDVVSGGDPSVSPFAGDYVAAGVSHIAFRIRASVVTNAVVAAVFSGGYSGLTWVKTLSSPAVAGVWVTNIVSVGTMEGWDSGASKNVALLWSNDIRNVKYAGVRLFPDGNETQAFDVSSFILVGPDFASAPALLVYIGDALKTRFGVRSIALMTDDQKTQDADKDGMSDLDEILTGTNPDNPNSFFTAQIVGTSAAGVTIRWPCLEGTVYTVSRTTDLVAGKFTALVQGCRLTATSTGYMDFTDTTVNAGDGPYFYRIVKE